MVKNRKNPATHKSKFSCKCYIIAEGFFLYYHFSVGYSLSFGLVRLRTIRLSAGADAHIECYSCSLLENVTITNVIIKTPDRKWGVNDVMPGSEGLGIES